MRGLAAILVTLTVSTVSAAADPLTSQLTRTLTVPGAPGTSGPPPPEIHVAPRFTTTLRFEMPVTDAQLTGPGEEHITVHRLGRDLVILDPVRELTAGQRPTLTITAEDGAHHAFTLVMDDEAPDVQVRVLRGPCLMEADLDAAAAQLLLREPVRQLERTAFHRVVFEKAKGEGAQLQVWGSLPLSHLSIVTLRIISDGSPFTLARAQFQSPVGRLRVLGTRPDTEGNVAIVVQRQGDEADGIAYTLTVSEKGGSRKLVAENVVPWPILPASPGAGSRREPLGPEEGSKADPDGRRRHGKLPRPQVLQRR